MKQRNKILIILLTLTLLITANQLFKDKKSSANFKSLQRDADFSSNTVEKFIADEAEIKRNIASEVEKSAKGIKQIKGKSKNRNPIITLLEEKKGDYFWSPFIYAINKKEFKGNSSAIIGKHLDLVLIKSNSKPDGAYSLVYNPNNKKIGIFLEKIFVVHEKSEAIENYIHAETGKSPDFHQGIYFVTIENFSDANTLSAKLKERFNFSKVNLDISYGRVIPN